MPTFCTLADQKYLIKLLCLIQSMREHVPDATLHVLALDDTVYDVLRLTADLGITRSVTRLAELEADDARLRDAKSNRASLEYIWTLTSYWLAYCMEGAPAEVARVIQLDADSYFFGDPQPVFDEIGDASVAVVPHRLAPAQREAFAGNGEYNVNFVVARNDPIGMAFAHEWRDLCLAWCYYRQEDGKFADQKYLETLAPKYAAHVIQQKGLNLAPWNQAQYTYAYQGRREQLFVEGDPLILFHFHEFASPESLTGWPLSDTVRTHVYVPYIKIFKQMEIFVAPGDTGAKT